MAGRNYIKDGNAEVESDIPLVLSMIARTAKWVHPDTFRKLPVWSPWAARGKPLYASNWERQYTNTRKSTQQTTDKFEGNGSTARALTAALDVAPPRPRNWTVCHLWGYDDPEFKSAESVVKDPHYFTCLANMIWLPTPLKGFTDAVPQVKSILRTCSFYLYGWVCEHETVKAQAQVVSSGVIPEGYPDDWPAPGRLDLRPIGMAPFTPELEARIETRKSEIRWMLNDHSLAYFPRDEVRRVLDFWKIDLSSR
jgi:hypothetical protein